MDKIATPDKSPISLLELKNYFQRTLGSKGSNNISDHMALDLIMHNQDVVMLKFYADWCPPCREWAPIVRQAASQYKNATVVEINIDKHKSVAKQYNVTRIPVGIYFANGKLVARSSGKLNLKDTCNFFDKAVKSLI